MQFLWTDLTAMTFLTIMEMTLPAKYKAPRLGFIHCRKCNNSFILKVLIVPPDPNPCCCPASTALPPCRRSEGIRTRASGHFPFRFTKYITTKGLASFHDKVWKDFFLPIGSFRRNQRYKFPINFIQCVTFKLISIPSIPSERDICLSSSSTYKPS